MITHAGVFVMYIFGLRCITLIFYAAGRRRACGSRRVFRPCPRRAEFDAGSTLLAAAPFETSDVSATAGRISSSLHRAVASTRRPTRRDVPPRLRRRPRRVTSVDPPRAPRGSPRAGRRPRGQHRALLRILRARDRRRRHRCRSRCVSRTRAPTPPVPLPPAPAEPSTSARPRAARNADRVARVSPASRASRLFPHPSTADPSRAGRNERRHSHPRRSVRPPRSSLDPRDATPDRPPHPIARPRPTTSASL